jgi:hypothetical protein
MNGNSAIIYDCEIINCIPSKGEPEDDLNYCRGWDDHANMGISCIGVYDYREDRYRVFLPDNLDEFRALIKEREHIIGFNSLSFDDALCRANNIDITTTYDLLRKVRRAAGEPEEYTQGVSSKGLSLGNLAQSNLGYGKSGNGALAPELWQRGHFGQVIDYCLQDVQITRKLLEMGCDKRRGLIDLNVEKKFGRHAFPDERWYLPSCPALT